MFEDLFEICLWVDVFVEPVFSGLGIVQFVKLLDCRLCL